MKDNSKEAPSAIARLALPRLENCLPEEINPSSATWEICLHFVNFDPTSQQFREDMFALQSLQEAGIAMFFYFSTSKTAYLKPFPGSKTQVFPQKILEIFQKSDYQVLALSSQKSSDKHMDNLQENFHKQVDQVLEARVSGQILDPHSSEIFDFTNKAEQIRTFDFQELIITIELQSDSKSSVIFRIMQLAERANLRFQTVLDPQNSLMVVRFYKMDSLSYSSKEMHPDDVSFIVQYNYVVGTAPLLR